MTDVDLGEIEITGIDRYPANHSVKLNGPPGTGKTTESAARVATLLKEYDFELNDVLWGTYRNSLAHDTLERLASWGVIPEAQLNKPREGPTRYIATMHALGARMIDTERDVVKVRDKIDFVSDYNLRWDRRHPWETPPGQLLFDVFNYAAKNYLDLTDPYERERVPKLEDLRDEWRGDVGRVWEDWERYKADNHLMDFWEQLAMPVERGVSVAKPVVVVDEYHDVYPLMHDFATALMDQAEVVIVAGDPLQVVNSYAGADPNYFQKLEYPEVLLDTTHRVPEEHWAMATHVLEKAHNAPPVTRKRQGAVRKNDSPEFVYSEEEGTWDTVPDASDEWGPVGILDRVGTDTMFLTRTQKQADGVCYALEQAGVLYETQQNMDREGWGAKEGMSERTALYNGLQKLHGIGRPDEGRRGLSKYQDAEERSPTEVVFRSSEAAALLDHASAKHLTCKRDEASTQAGKWHDRESVVRGEEFVEWVEPEFFDLYTRGPGAIRHTIKGGQATDSEQLSDRDLDAIKIALRENDEPVMGVDTKVYTIHASKGSEAANVVVYDGITARTRKEIRHDPAKRANEYRTWYVALTRASENLFILHDTAFEWVDGFLPSGLLREAKIAHNRGVASDD